MIKRVLLIGLLLVAVSFYVYLGFELKAAKEDSKACKEWWSDVSKTSVLPLYCGEECNGKGIIKNENLVFFINTPLDDCNLCKVTVK